MQDLKDKVIAITGGATGIGFALAKTLGQEGAKIIIGEPRKEKLEDAVKILRDLGIEAYETFLDVTNLKSVEEFAEFTIKSFGHVDILINNAGISGARGRIDKVDINEAKNVFDVNFFGVWHGCAVFSKKMIERGTSAAIYNLGSENSLFIAVPKSVAYVASKHAVFALSESLRNDLPDYIHVGTIFPGYVDTPLTSQVEGGMNVDEFANIIKEQIKNEEHIIVSHAYNSVHIERRNEEITTAYKKYAPRYDGDDEYDIKTIFQNYKN
jgi:NAD(P)-dependent dehydrogenase (short-subunit alcohol dehydrogenase family)